MAKDAPRWQPVAQAFYAIEGLQDRGVMFVSPQLAREGRAMVESITVK